MYHDCHSSCDYFRLFVLICRCGDSIVAFYSWGCLKFLFLVLLLCGFFVVWVHLWFPVAFWTSRGLDFLYLVFWIHFPCLLESSFMDCIPFVLSLLYISFPFLSSFPSWQSFFWFSLCLFFLLPHVIAASGRVISLLSLLSFAIPGSFVLFFLLVLLLLVCGSVLHLRSFLSCFLMGAFLCLASLSFSQSFFRERLLLVGWGRTRPLGVEVFCIFIEGYASGGSEVHYC